MYIYICCQQNETVKHYLLSCPRFTAQRNELLTSAAQVCGKAWLTSTDNGKLELLLNGFAQLSFTITTIFYCSVLSTVLFWILFASPINALCVYVSCLFCNTVLFCLLFLYTSYCTEFFV